MRTRTLLLLAIGCGLAILLAGGIQLLRVGGQQQSTKLLSAGEPGKAGDVTVELVSSSVRESELVAVVRIGGTDDPNGLNDFALVGPGTKVSVTSSTCEGITEPTADCSLTFTTSGMVGTARQLIFDRADTQLGWVLVGGD